MISERMFVLVAGDFSFDVDHAQRYTHGSGDHDNRVRKALADISLTIDAQEDQK